MSDNIKDSIEEENLMALAELLNSARNETGVTKLYARWGKLVEHSAAFIFGEEDVDLTDFADLVEQSWIYIINFCDKARGQKLEESEIFDYVKLVSQISIYEATIVTSDFEKNYFVSKVVARQLALFACTGHSCISTTEQIVQGEICVRLWDTMDCDGIDSLVDINKVYKYDIKKKDFTELFELADTFEKLNASNRYTTYF